MSFISSCSACQLHTSINSEILDIGKLFEVGVDLKKLSQEHISSGFRGDPGVQSNPPFCQNVKVFCFVFLYNGFINSLAPIERARERALPLLFKLGLLKHRKWACFYTESGRGHPNFSGGFACLMLEPPFHKS